MSNNRPMPRVPTPVILASVAWVVGLAAGLTLDDPRLRYDTFLATSGLTAIGWFVLLRHAKRVPMALVLVLGISARLWALSAAPAFSEDVFRYVYEGRLVWHLGPAAPFVYAPAAGPDLGLGPDMLDAAWLRINHPEISTIYPPFAQLVFAAAGGLANVFGHALIFLKLFLVAADLGTWALLVRALKAQGRSPSESLVWGLCPLVILEVAREGHADSLSALGLALGLLGFTAARPKLGYIGWALAALAKLNGLVVIPAALRSTRRGLGTAILLCSLLSMPWLLAGPSAGEGLSQYASRWRAGDGAFTLVLSFSELLLGGDWAQWGSVSVTKHQVARGLTVLLFGGASLITLAKAAPLKAVPARAGTLLFILLLLAPTLHPWYVLWLLPFAAAADDFSPRRAILLLAALAVLFHHPGWLELLDGQWRDLGWVRACVHLPVWGLWLWDLARRPKSGYPAPGADRATG